MDTRQGSKLTSNVAADDSISLDSLSFTGLVSVHDQLPKLPSPNHQAKHYRVSKHDPEFEFTSTKENFNSAVNSIKITPADQLISNGQLQPQAQAFQTTQSLITNPPRSARSQALAFQTTRSLIASPPSSRSLLAIHVSSEMSNGKTGSSMKYHEQLGKAGKHTNKQSTVTTRTWFGQKMKSFLSPCQECRTVKPGAVKAQTVQRENFKIY